MKPQSLDRFAWVIVLPLLTQLAWGDFEPPVRSRGGSDGLVVGDVNGDGRDDLITFSSGSDPVLRVLLSGDNGTLDESAALVGAQGRLTGIPDYPVIDANGDGHLDVVASSWVQRGPIRRIWLFGSPAEVAEATLYENLWTGNGDGTFAPLVITSRLEFHDFFVPRAELGRAGVAGEFNDDGLEDTAGLSRDRRNRLIGPVVIYLTMGDGSDPARLYVDVGDGRFNTIVSGDFNGDGWDDIVVAKSNRLLALLNDADW
jgi:hypothetical protein